MTAASRRATSIAASKPMTVGIVGCGAISRAYLETLSRLGDVEVSAVADLDPERAKAAASAWPGASALDVDQLMESAGIDVVVNLTVPAAHSEVASRAIASGKHVYNEKPLAADASEAAQLLLAAASGGLRVGCAPDTVLGTGIQTARQVIDTGRIGTPVAATAFMTTAGHERWHHHPEFYYLRGGGPLFDMGPYYLTALLHLLGPVRRVFAASSRSRQIRAIGSGPGAGKTFPVEVDTHVTGILEHAAGALSTLVMSFDVWAARLPRIEVYGLEGSLSVPDPNRFDGMVERYSPAAGGWEPVKPMAGYVDAARGYGVADMARAIVAGRPHLASGEVARHVLEVMTCLLESARAGSSRELTTSCERPAPVPLGALPQAGA